MNGKKAFVERLVSVGIDWVTATAKRGHRGDLLETIAQQWTEKRAQEGYQSELWHWNGYNGATIDGISYGHRDDSNIIKLSSEMAREHGIQAISFSDQVTRVDLQATYAFEGANVNFATLYAATLPQVPRIASGHLQLRLTAGTTTGETLYIGSRASDRLYRVYDKHKESKGIEPEGTWRWEIEYKGERAKRVAARLVTVGGEALAIREILAMAFADVGVQVPGPPVPRGWKDTSMKPLTNDQRRLEWLEKSVGPMVRRLIEAGHSRAIRHALYGKDPEFDAAMDEVYQTFGMKSPG